MHRNYMFQSVIRELFPVIQIQKKVLNKKHNFVNKIQHARLSQRRK